MKTKYIPTPPDWSPGEIEALYEKMAKKGWRLGKIGVHFSRFKKAEPEELSFRVEYLTSDFGAFEAPAMEDEKLALIEESGWELRASRGYLSVFSAPKGAPVPEIHTDPRSQAATLKSLRRSGIVSLLVVALYLGFILLMSASMGSGVIPALRDAAVEAAMSFYKATGIMILWECIFLSSLFSLICGIFGTGRLYRSLKKGRPIDHAPKKRHLIRKCVNCAFALLGAASLILTAAQLFTLDERAMPTDSDGLYITFSDVGLSGERVPNIFDGGESRVETVSSFIAHMENTREFVSLSGSTWYAYIYQDVYKTASEELAKKLVRLLMYDATFGDGPESFDKIDPGRLDEAYTCGLDTILRKENTVWYISHSKDVTAEALIDAAGRK